MNLRSSLFRFILSLTFVSFTLPAMAESDNTWRHAMSEDGIDVYLSPYKGYEVEGFRASTRIKGDRQKVFDIFKDVAKYPKWLADCSIAKLIQQKSPLENIVYFSFDSPWPVQDRDVTFHRVISETESGGLKLSFNAVSDQLESQDCCVRIERSTGYFLVEPLAGTNELLVTYESVSDPAGNLPSWLMNYVITDSPLNSLKKFRQIAKKLKD